MTDRYDRMFTLTQPPEGAICDFCSTPDVHWSYPCRDHAQKTEHAESLVLRRDGSHRVVAADIDGFSHGGWAACNACHALIERGDRATLARRSAKRIVRKLRDQGTTLLLKNAIAHTRRLHDQFWQNRDGPAIYHEHRPSAEDRDPTR